MKKMKRNYISRILRESINHILKENFNDPSYYRRKALAKVLNVNMNDISCVDNDDDNMEYEYDGDDYYVFALDEDAQKCYDKLMELFGEDPESFLYDYIGKNSDNFENLEPLINRDQIDAILINNYGIDVNAEEDEDPIDIYIKYFGETKTEDPNNPCLMDLITENPYLLNVDTIIEHARDSYGSNYAILGEKIGEPVVDDERYYVYKID